MIAYMYMLSYLVCCVLFQYFCEMYNPCEVSNISYFEAVMPLEKKAKACTSVKERPNHSHISSSIQMIEVNSC